MDTRENLPILSSVLSADAWELELLPAVSELAAHLGVPVSTVYDWRTHGRGPIA